MFTRVDIVDGEKLVFSSKYQYSIHPYHTAPPSLQNFYFPPTRATHPSYHRNWSDQDGLIIIRC